MRIKIKVRDVGGDSFWWEEHDTRGEDPDEFVQKLMDFFNSTLHPGQSRRETLIWESSEGEAIAGKVSHQWTKTSLVTEVGGFDKMRCETCGITGKRYGLGQFDPVRDKKFKHVRFEDCRLSQEYLKKAAERAQRRDSVIRIQFAAPERKS